MSEKTELQTSDFQNLDVRDEKQILAEIQGEINESYVYRITLHGREITNLSYAGIKEMIRRRQNFQIVEHTEQEANGKIRATVKVKDLINNVEFLGAAEAEVDKPFAWVLAINKAERNAYAKAIPTAWLAAIITDWLKLKKQEPQSKVVLDVTQPKEEPKQTPPKDDVPLAYKLNAEIPPEIAANLDTNEDNTGRIRMKPIRRLEAEEFKTVCKAVEKFGGVWDKTVGEWRVPA